MVLMNTSRVNLDSLFKRTVFLLGAGASMDAGCLSSRDMLQDLRNQIENHQSRDARKQYSAIYDFVIQSLVYQQALKGGPNSKVMELANIEDFVAVIKQIIDREYIVPPPLVGNWNNKIIGWEINNENVFTEFLDYVYECLITKWTQYDRQRAQPLIQPIRRLLESDQNFDLSVFSLNYDLIFESLLNSDEEKLVHVGFSPDRWIGDFGDPNDGTKLKFFKLHGSVDWYFDEQDQEVKLGVPDGAKPLLVFGSGSKIQSYDPFLSLLANFSEKLKSSILYVVVGYSFHDKYINNILIQGLSAELNKKMIVVDPCMELDNRGFIEQLEGFQRLKSMNEIVNLTRISPARVEILKITAQEFYSTYFSDEAAKLQEIMDVTEKGDQIFT